MYKVYILRSVNSDETYVGLTTKDIEERLKEHNEGKSHYTKRHAPWGLVYYEIFYCKTCAEARERFFKTGFGVKVKQILIENLG